MSAITSMDQLVSALRNPRPFYKSSVTSAVAGQLQSLWRANGEPTAGAIPASGSGAACSSSTSGALLIDALASGESLFLARLSVLMSTSGSVLLYDRLVANKPARGNLNTSQTVNSVALPRFTDGIGVEIWLEVYTAVGATAATVTVSYTNQDGTPGRTSIATISIASAGAGRMFKCQLQAGDTGVLSVQSATLSASTGTAGNFGITLLYRLSEAPVLLANLGIVLDQFALGLPTLAQFGDSQPCLAMAVLCTTTSTGNVMGSISCAVN